MINLSKFLNEKCLRISVKSVGKYNFHDYLVNSFICSIVNFKKIFYLTNRMPFFGKCGCSSKKDLDELNILNYAHNSLTHVPEEIMVHERTLEELYLDANRISELPRVIIFLLTFIFRGNI